MDDTSSVTKTSTYIEPKVWQGLSTTKSELSSNLERRSLQNRMGARKDPMEQVRITEHAEPRLQGPEEPRNSRKLQPMR